VERIEVDPHAMESSSRDEERKRGREREVKEKNRERKIKSQRLARQAEQWARRRRIPSTEESSSGHERARSLDRGRDEKARNTSYSEGEEEIVKAPVKRGPGRPLTTADYVGIRQEKERLNREKEQELKLLHEERIAKLVGR